MLFVLPFDHRATFAKELLGFSYPRLTPPQRKEVVTMKRVVFDGFLKARAQVSNPEDLSILVDEESGADIIKEATKKQIPFALSIEKSGQQLFDFEYGKNFPAHLKKWKPTFAKALVRYNVADTKNNRVQNARLKILSAFCKKAGIGFMIEPLMTGTGSRFTQLQQTMQEMMAAGISPTVWKVEGLDTPAQWKELRKLTNADIIVLGRGDTKKHVEKWLKTAAQSGVVNGFAVGRTIFMQPLMQYRDKKITRDRAVESVAKNFTYFIKLWKQYARA